MNFPTGAAKPAHHNFIISLCRVQFTIGKGHQTKLHQQHTALPVHIMKSGQHAALIISRPYLINPYIADFRSNQLCNNVLRDKTIRRQATPNTLRYRSHVTFGK